jgi:hypothetical protein
MKRNILLKRAISMILTAILVIGQIPLLKVAAYSFISSDSTYYYLQNSKIKITIQKNVGYIYEVRNLISNYSYKTTAGAWPFKISVGTSSTSEISNSGTLCKNTVSSATINTGTNGDEYLEVIYTNLKNSSSTNMNVKATVRYYINSTDDYMRFNVKFENQGSNAIEQIYLCEGGNLTAGAAATDKLVIPIWGEMAYWTNPNSAFSAKSISSPERMSYPGTGWNDMEMGFVDLSGTSGGIGIAYINKTQTHMEFRIAKDGTGVSLSPSLLNSELGINTTVTNGQTFQTDNVVIAAHQGDWHRMADIYRTEYQKAFVNVDATPDYLTKETLSQTAKNADFMLRYVETGFNNAYLDVVNTMKRYNDITSANRLMVWYSGQNEHGYGHDTPTMLPANASYGGTAGLLKLSDDLHALGASIFHYEHPSAFASDSSDKASIAAAIPSGQYTNTWNSVLHYYANVDDPLIQNLWTNKLIPELKTVKPDGLQFDQGSLQFTIPASTNGGLTDATSRLSAISKGTVALSKNVRNNLSTGQTAYIASEGFSDLTGRYMDVVQSRWDQQTVPTAGGKLILGGRQYVFPQYIQQYNQYKYDGTNSKDMRLYAALLGGIYCFNDGAANSLSIDREAISFKTKMREISAPGYPFNYKDDLGLTTNDTALVSKVFTDNNMATITFLSDAKSITNANITFNPQSLGVTGPIKSFTFNTVSDQLGYIVLNMTTGEITSSSVSLTTKDCLSLYAGDFIKNGRSQFNGMNIADSNAVEFNTSTGEMTLKSGNISTESFKGTYKNFTYDFNLTPSWGTGLTNQWGFAMYFMDTDGVNPQWLHGTNNRYMIYATASNKIQLARYNGATTSWLTGEIIIPDMDNQNMQCRLSCSDENGATNISFMINGTEYIYYSDTNASRLTTAGYITMLNHGTGAGLSLKISGNNPNVQQVYAENATKLYAGDMIKTGADNFNINHKSNVTFNTATSEMNLQSGDINIASYKGVYKNFDYNFTLNPSWGTGLEGQWGFAMYFMDTNGINAHWDHGSSSRYMLIFNSPTNVQLARYNDTTDTTWLTGGIAIPNINNQQLNCRLDCVEENGATRITLVINGIEYLNYLDSSAQRLMNAGYITFINHGTGAGLSLKVSGINQNESVGNYTNIYAGEMIKTGRDQFNGNNIADKTKITLNNSTGEILLKSGNISTVSNKTAYKDFSYHFSLTPSWGTGLKNQWGLAMYFMDSDGVNPQWAHGTNSRYMIMFNDSSNIQLARYKGSTDAAWLTGNINISDVNKKLLDCQLICTDENGATRIVLRINGVQYLDYLDNSENRLTQAGYITFANHGTGAGLSLKIGGTDKAKDTLNTEKINSVNWIANGLSSAWQGNGVGNASNVEFTADNKLKLYSNAINSASFCKRYTDFDVTFNMNAKWNAGAEGQWGWYIFFRDTSGVIANWDSSISKSRYFIYAKNSGEIQLGKHINETDTWFQGATTASVDMNNKDIRCRLNVVNVDAGVSIEFYINGIKTLSYLDSQTPSNQPITTPGYITFLNHNLTGNPLIVTTLQPTTGISLNKSTETLVHDTSSALSSTLSPSDVSNSNVTWSSSNSDIAIVNQSGLVTALKAGTSTITATTADGSYSAYYVATVKPISFDSYNVSADKIITKVQTGMNVLQIRNSLNPAINVSLVFKNIDSMPLANGDNIGTGSTVVVTYTGYSATYLTLIYGDINGDGNISIEDLVYVKRHLLKISTLSGISLSAAKIFKRADVSISDLLAIKKQILGIDALSQF